MKNEENKRDAINAKYAVKSALLTALLDAIAERNLTQKQVASMCGVSQGYISGLYSKDIPPVSAEKLINMLVILGKTITLRIGDPNDNEIVNVLKIANRNEEEV